jgi:hypothetical protein
MTPVPLLTFGSPAFKQIQIRAGLTLKAAGATVRFEIEDPDGELVWPQPSIHGTRNDELWKKTCFELFLRDPKSDLYWEWNFSPSGDWGCFAFDDYRQRLPTRGPQGISQFHLEGWGGVSILEVTIDLSFSPQLSFLRATAQPLSYQLSAVGELKDGSRSYWALAHLRPKADFHAPEAFLAY